MAASDCSITSHYGTSCETNREKKSDPPGIPVADIRRKKSFAKSAERVAPLIAKSAERDKSNFGDDLYHTSKRCPTFRPLYIATLAHFPPSVRGQKFWKKNMGNPHMWIPHIWIVEIKEEQIEEQTAKTSVDRITKDTLTLTIAGSHKVVCKGFTKHVI